MFISSDEGLAEHQRRIGSLICLSETAYRNALLLAGDKPDNTLCIRFHCCFETFGEKGISLQSLLFHCLFWHNFFLWLY